MVGVMQVSPAAASGAGVFDLPLVVHPIPVAGYTRRHVAYAIPQDTGTTVASWPDLMGGSPLTPNGAGGTTNTPPLLASDGGVPTVEFTGTAALGVAMPVGQPHTIVTVARLVGTPSALGTLTGGRGAVSGRSAQFVDPTTSQVWRGNAGSSLASTIAASTTTHQVITTVFDGANSVMRVDGTETTGTTGTEARTILTLATGDTLGGSKLNCRIAEVVIYPFALTQAQRVSVEAAVLAGRTL